MLTYILGHVVEYDMTTGKILRTLEDAHPLGSAVTHVRFTDDQRYINFHLCRISHIFIFSL